MSETPPETKPTEAPLHGLLAEYDSPAKLIEASKSVRDAGFRNWDTFTPFPVHGIDPAMGIRATALPWIVLGGGLTGCAGAVLLQWWTNAFDYAWIVSGKPFWSLPANIPITFELTVLLSALTCFFGMLILNRLPRPAHPLDHVKRFERVSDDRFFLLIQASDPKFEEAEARQLLEKTETSGLELVKEDIETSASVPKGIIYGLLMAAAAATVPFALTALARESTSPSPRFHIVPDMDWQTKYKAQRANDFFTDGRAMREPVEGTVAFGELHDDDHFHRGKIGKAWARTFPPQVKPTAETIAHGQERFNVFCSPCHGVNGQGKGMVQKRIEDLTSARVPDAVLGWVNPTNMVDQRLHYMPVGEIFNTVTNGIRKMPAYGRQVPAEDRWAIIMYVRALQRSQATTIKDVPPAMRGKLAKN